MIGGAARRAAGGSVVVDGTAISIDEASRQGGVGEGGGDGGSGGTRAGEELREREKEGAAAESGRGECEATSGERGEIELCRHAQGS